MLFFINSAAMLAHLILINVIIKYKITYILDVIVNF